MTKDADTQHNPFPFVQSTKKAEPAAKSTAAAPVAKTTATEEKEGATKRK